MSLHAYLIVGLLLFCMGLFAVLNRQHLIGILVGVELMLNAASLNFMAVGRFTADEPTSTHTFVLFIIGLAAAEAAIALSIIVAVYRSRHSADVGRLQDLKG